MNLQQFRTIDTQASLWDPIKGTHTLKEAKREKTDAHVLHCPKTLFFNQLIYFFNTYITVLSLFNEINFFDFES